ncbi:MAG: DNA polymerase IV [Patescibacteria group bacterium]
MTKIILHIDMNSYFASVEQQANPLLRGKSVGVCAYLSRNGCVIASSVEAKERGVTVGLRAWEARAIDPQVILIQNDPPKYRSVTRGIFSILDNYTSKLEPYSIDEAFLDLTDQISSFAEARTIGKEIQRRIRSEVGEWLRASVGIAGTRWLAKFASDIAKADSILVLPKSELESCYRSVKLTDAWGINTAMERRLNYLGINNLNDLKNYPATNLMQVFGKMGYYLWANVNGIELGGVGQPPPPKTIGHSYCLPKRTLDRSYHQAILMKLCDRVGRRLRSHGREAKGIYLAVSYRGTVGYHKSHQTLTPLYDGWEIYAAADKLFQAAPNDRVVVMIAVAVFELRPFSGQLELFNRKRQPRQLVQAMDKINDKFGDFTLIRGQMWGTKKNAPERIGFRKTVSLKELFQPPDLKLDKNE